MSTINENLSTQTQLCWFYDDYIEPICYCGACEPVSVASVLASVSHGLVFISIHSDITLAKKQRNENSTHLTKYKPETFSIV